VGGLINPIVYPSGSANASSVHAISPTAPGIFTIAKLCPKYFSAYWKTSLAAVSVPPPGSNPTNTVTGFSGYVATASSTGVSSAGASSSGAGVEHAVNKSEKANNNANDTTNIFLLFILILLLK